MADSGPWQIALGLPAKQAQESYVRLSACYRTVGAVSYHTKWLNRVSTESRRNSLASGNSLPNIEHSLIIGATVEQLKSILGTFDRFWAEVVETNSPPPPDDVGHCMKAAAMEIATNIVRHAQPTTKPPGVIRIVLSLYPDRIVADFYDRGLNAYSGYVVPSPERDVLEDILPDGGLGLFLVHRSVDECRYTRTGAGANYWRLVKLLA